MCCWHLGLLDDVCKQSDLLEGSNADWLGLVSILSDIFFDDIWWRCCPSNNAEQPLSGRGQPAVLELYRTLSGRFG